jgi:cobalt/nickel transport system ATP-binding protein
VSLSVAEGEAVAIVGANGAGKSTLLQHLCGILLPTAGTVEIDGTTVERHSLATVRRQVGMVFQDPDDQLFLPTVLQDVAFGPRNLGLAEPQERALRALAAVGAQGLADKAPYHLSTGEKKRVAIATVLAMEPTVLVMDEPTAGLDPCARRQVMGLLKGFPQTRIIASHDLDMVAEVCSRVLVLADGLLAADGLVADVFGDRELLARCRLEPPLGMQGCPVCGTTPQKT